MVLGRRRSEARSRARGVARSRGSFSASRPLSWLDRSRRRVTVDDGVSRERRTPNPGRERPRREGCIRVVRRATLEVGRGTRCPRSSIYLKLADFRAPSMTRRIGRAAAIHEGRTAAERKTETSARIETSRGNRSRVDSRGGYIGVGFHGSARERGSEREAEGRGWGDATEFRRGGRRWWRRQSERRAPCVGQKATGSVCTVVFSEERRAGGERQ